MNNDEHIVLNKGPGVEAPVMHACVQDFWAISISGGDWEEEEQFKRATGRVGQLSACHKKMLGIDF